MHELGSKFLSIFERLFLLLRPALGTKRVKLWGFTIVTDVFLYKVRLLDRNIEVFLIGIFNLYIIAFGTACLDPVDLHKSPDSVIHMDNIIPFLEFHEGIERR